MTLTILTLLTGCVATWHLTRKRTSVRVTRQVQLTLERRERMQRFKRNVVIALVVLMIIVVLAVSH